MITDFVTGRQINTGNIEKMIRYAEEAEEFFMIPWFNHCKTAGCLCGTYCIRESRGMDNVRVDEVFIQNELGIGRRAFYFLFTTHRAKFDFDPIKCKTVKTNYSYTSKEARFTDKQQAISRLRKFLLYKIRKSQLLSDPNARTKEGNWNLLLEVLNSVAV